MAVASATAVVLVTPGTAQAHGGRHGPTVRTITKDALAPFQLAVSRGSLYVADGGKSQVLKVGRKGALTPVADGPQPGEVAGVAFDRSGRAMAYTTTSYTDGATTLTIKEKGKKTVVADLSTFEATHNPDSGVTYGVDNPSQCVQDAFAPLGGATSTGGVDSHPYSVASLGHGAWVVADAGGNDLLKVDRHGHVSVLALLPRQPTVITAEIAGGLGLPDCVVGITYNFEPVPTDVEVGRWGQLVVSLLPGGPEDPSLGARGSVYRVNPWNGHATKLAGGFLGATNVALGPWGQVYVAELFAGRISTVGWNGHVSKLVDLPAALSVEWGDGGLYAGTLGTDEEGQPNGMGSLVRITR
ncbi:ScyD/ScyE family protein [Angustibacter peucedani]